MSLKLVQAIRGGDKMAQAIGIVDSDPQVVKHELLLNSLAADQTEKTEEQSAEDKKLYKDFLKRATNPADNLYEGLDDIDALVSQYTTDYIGIFAS